MTAPKASMANRVGRGCLVMVALPFVLLGILTTLSGWSLVKAGEIGRGLPQMLIGAVIASAPFAVGRWFQRQVERGFAGSSEPSGVRSTPSNVIEDGSRGRAPAAWVGTAVAVGFAVPMVSFGFRDMLAEEPLLILVLISLALFVAVFLVRAIRETIRRVRFGVTRVELDTVPGTAGGTLEGQLVGKGGLGVAHRVTLRLSCFSSDHSSAQRHGRRGRTAQWTEQIDVVPNRERAEITVPFVFRIPADQPPTQFRAGGPSVAWMLDAEARAPFGSYKATFRVPVS